jgi:ABC-type Fe3+-siderophore transport system permease subunit
MSELKALIIILPILALSFIFLLYAREFNVILLGDEHAKHLGLDVRFFKRMTILLVSILTAISVAFSGIIGFLGLIVPHTARMIVGGDHRLLIPTSMVLGANVLLAADIFSRLAVRPNETAHRGGHIIDRCTIFHIPDDQKGEGIWRMIPRFPSRSRASSSDTTARTY